MADYVKILFNLLMSVFTLLQCSLLSESSELTCGFPGAPAYGYVRPNQDAYNKGEYVRYACSPGHIILGKAVRMCNEDGTWSNKVPICDDSMAHLLLASATPNTPGHPPDLAIDKNRDTCTYLKPKKPRWWRIDLGGLQNILSVAVSVVSTDKRAEFIVYIIEVQGQSASYKRCAAFNGKFGSQTIVFTCAEGKGLTGQKIHIEDRIHEDIFELCEVEVQVEKDTGYDCGQPDTRLNSKTMEYKSDDDKVEYECNTGYELIGDSTRECLSTGQWSGDAPVCEPIECVPLKDLENGELTYHTVDDDGVKTYSVENADVILEGTTANYKCDYGYMLDGDFTRLCLKDGSWSGREPSCKVIRCPLPAGSHDGETYRMMNRTNRVGSMAKLRCRKGIKVGDDPYITCTADGVWTLPKVECIQEGAATMSSTDEPRIVNRGGVIFGMAAAAIMMIIILVSFYVVKRRRDANKPKLPSRQHEPPVPPPRPPPRGKGLESTLMDFVTRHSGGHKYESLNVDDVEGRADWKTRSLPLEPGNNEKPIDDLGAPRRTISYDDKEKLSSGEQAVSQDTQEQRKDTPGEGRVITPGGEYAAVDYDKKRQSRLLKEQDSEERIPSAAGSEKFRDLPPIPKEEEEEEGARKSVEMAPSPTAEEKKAQDAEEAASEISEDVSLPVGDSQTSEAPTPSPDVVIENQVDGTSASPITPPPEDTPERRRRRGAPEDPAPEPEPRRTRTRRRTAESEEPESPPTPAVEEGRPTRRTRRTTEPGEAESPPAAPVEDERPSRRTRRTTEPEEPESPPPAPVEDERPARRTRVGRFDTPSTTSFQPSSRRRY